MVYPVNFCSSLNLKPGLVACHLAALKGRLFEAKRGRVNNGCGWLAMLSIPDAPCMEYYLHDWVILVVNVGKYSIHGAYGYQRVGMNHTNVAMKKRHIWI